MTNQETTTSLSIGKEYKKMHDKQFEKSIIQNCAAMLAGMKIGNLFNHRFLTESECKRALDEANAELNRKGVYIEVLMHFDDFYLIYVYRRGKLCKYLRSSKARALLLKYGYDMGEGTEGIIEYLRKRIAATSSFPHEIGVFLGYPIDDIRGFVRNHGRNCMRCGIWKVYTNPREAEAYFCKIEKCNTVYMNVYESGRKLIDMTVTA